MWLCLLINRNEVPRMRNYVKKYGLLSFAKYLSYKYGKKLPYTATKVGLDSPKELVSKTADAAAEMIENKTVGKIVKLLLKQKQDFSRRCISHQNKHKKH